MVDDATFTQQFLSALDFFSHSMPKQMVAFKDLNFVVTYCSKYYVECLGTTEKKIIGRAYSAFLYDGDLRFADIILAEDREVTQKREPKVVLKIHRFKKKSFLPYLCLKTPVINPDTQNVVGILVEGIELGLSSLIQKILLSPPIPKKQVNLTTLPHLSKREKQVVFLFLANLSSQAIADLLYKLEGKKVSKSTIDSLFNEQLYPKFNVYSRHGLYKKLQELGYESLVPKELLQNTSTLLDSATPY